MPKLYEVLAEAFRAEGVDTQFVLKRFNADSRARRAQIAAPQDILSVDG